MVRYKEPAERRRASGCSDLDTEPAVAVFHSSNDALFIALPVEPRPSFSRISADSLRPSRSFLGRFLRRGRAPPQLIWERQ